MYVTQPLYSFHTKKRIESFAQSHHARLISDVLTESDIASTLRFLMSFSRKPISIGNFLF